MADGRGRHPPIGSWQEFQQRWGGLHNCLMQGELTACLPDDYELPPLERIIEAVRADSAAVIRSGVKGDDFDLTDISEDFRSLPLEAAMESRFILAHFSLHERLGGPGQIFEGLEERWVEPWRQALTARGFTFDNIFLILFAAGPHSATNYHMDYTQQLSWQVSGTKHWHGLHEPDRWTSKCTQPKARLHACDLWVYFDDRLLCLLQHWSNEVTFSWRACSNRQRSPHRTSTLSLSSRVPTPGPHMMYLLFPVPFATRFSIELRIELGGETG